MFPCPLGLWTSLHHIGMQSLVMVPDRCTVLLAVFDSNKVLCSPVPLPLISGSLR